MRPNWPPYGRPGPSGRRWCHIPARRNLKVKVTEARTGNLTFGAGYSSLEGAVAFAEVTSFIKFFADTSAPDALPKLLVALRTAKSADDGENRSASR